MDKKSFRDCAEKSQNYFEVEHIKRDKATDDYDIIFTELNQGGMKMYKETSKEKVIRFSIIAAIATVTLYLFVNQYTPQEESATSPAQEKAVKQMAVVLQEQNQEHDVPKLTMVKEHEGEPILVTYQVDTENNYRFETLHAVNLKNTPTDMQQDKNTDGIWLREENNWTYYSPELQVEKRSEEFRKKAEKNFTTNIEEMEAGKYILQVDNEQGPVLEKKLEGKPVSIVRLSENDDLWLVLFEKETILLVP
ncbi:hypothetical protein AB685_18850 [Bacillus sp. LL01]|uniref:hypothetical protein n=1 Tax=Bacillus sp. LL01 TaxID=1665556 RepID=UPI00064D5AB8|nr:hypothetical protein [Bacillus sp. LL01]KMJ57057.1 hypothetical protein AB685_18850 [Bacillus sp. LL01]